MESMLVRGGDIGEREKKARGWIGDPLGVGMSLDFPFLRQN